MSLRPQVFGTCFAQISSGCYGGESKPGVCLALSTAYLVAMAHGTLGGQGPRAFLPLDHQETGGTHLRGLCWEGSKQMSGQLVPAQRQLKLRLRVVPGFSRPRGAGHSRPGNRGSQGPRVQESPRPKGTVSKRAQRFSHRETLALFLCA